jgi:hypothetical protein
MSEAAHRSSFRIHRPYCAGSTSLLTSSLKPGVARREARIRFLKAQVEILRRELGGNRAILSPDDRARVLAIGQELNHNVADIIGIVAPQTHRRQAEELPEGYAATLPRNVELALVPDDRQTRNGYPLASRRLSALLALEFAGKKARLLQD